MDILFIIFITPLLTPVVSQNTYSHDESSNNAILARLESLERQNQQIQNSNSLVVENARNLERQLEESNLQIANLLQRINVLEGEIFNL